MMPHVTVREELPASRDVIWSLLRDFADLSAFLPEVKTVSIRGSRAGAVRHVETASGLFIEHCEAHNEAGRTVSYTVDESPPSFPYRNYHAVFKLTDGGPDRCVIEWSCDFDAYPEQEESLVKSLESLYRDGFIASIRQTVQKGKG